MWGGAWADSQQNDLCPRHFLERRGVNSKSRVCLSRTCVFVGLKARRETLRDAAHKLHAPGDYERPVFPPVLLV